MDKKATKGTGGIKMEYELRPIYDSRKSFYRKAIVKTETNKIKLQSYNTIVAEIIYPETGNKKAVVHGTYSNTALRHIKEFLKQNGFEADTINEVRKYMEVA